MEKEIIEWLLNHGFVYVSPVVEYRLRLPDRTLYGFRRDRRVLCIYRHARSPDFLGRGVPFGDIDELELAVIYQSLRLD